MQLELSEWIANLTKDYVESHQGSKFSDVSLRYGDSLFLPPFAKVRVSDPDPNAEDAFPVLYIAPNGAELDFGVGFGERAIATGDWVFTVWIRCDDMSGYDTWATAAKATVMRTVVALVEMLIECGQTGGPTWGQTGRTEIRYTGTQAIDLTYFASASVRMGVIWQED